MTLLMRIFPMFHCTSAVLSSYAPPMLPIMFLILLSFDELSTRLTSKCGIFSDQPAYWLGKKSLNKWWTQVDCGSGTSNLNRDCDSTDEGDASALVEVFNSDITCPHGKPEI